MFGDDAGEVAPASSSILYAENGGRDIRPLLDQLKGLGFEAGRWFASFLTPSSTRAGQTLAEAEARAPIIAGYLRERAMWGHAVGFCDTASWGANVWAQFNAHADWFGRFLAEHPWIIGEIENEIDHSSQYPFTRAALADFAARIRAAGYRGPLTAGAWVRMDEIDPTTGEYWPAGVDGTDVADTHFERTNDPAWDMANHGFAELRVIGNQYRRSRLSGEPKRSDDGNHPPSVFPFLLGLMGQLFNTWTTFHSSSTRDGVVLAGSELEDAKWFMRGARAVPRGRYHYENANNTGAWPNSPVKSAAFVEGPATTNDQTVWRAQSYLHLATGQWYLHVYGPDATRPHLEMQNGFAPPDERDLVDACGQWSRVYRIFQR